MAGLSSLRLVSYNCRGWKLGCQLIYDLGDSFDIMFFYKNIGCLLISYICFIFMMISFPLVCLVWMILSYWDIHLVVVLFTVSFDLSS